MQQADSLIRTKLRLPFTRPALVSRPRLQEQIVRGLRGPLTLLTAPAGFGKTTLVASCVANCGMAVAWLSLDTNDNQAGRFLTYLVAALHEADKAIGSEAAQLVAAQPAPPEAVLTSLINDLDNVGKGIVLVLDDYQSVHSQAVHEALAFLLEHCPRTLHLVISTRADPPLPLARLRVRGQTVELRAADLRFTESETAQFLNDIMGLRLDPGAVAALEERTEGWIAGLQMAALSIRDRKDTAEFISGFSGTNRYILDYLLEEVLVSQPADIQRFLVGTSVLERLTAPLCDAVLDAVLTIDNGWTGEDDNRPANPEARYHQSASILESLEGANLFVVPLDDERIWYRYHHLFADLLRAQLSNSPYARHEVLLHARASTWYETNGFPEEAIHHALAARDYPRAARQAEAAAEHTWLTGQYASILAWTNALPAEVVHSSPWLCIWNAWAYTQMGMPQAITQWIEAAEEAAGGAPDDAQSLMSEIAALRTFAVSFSREYGRAIELAEEVLKNPPLKHNKASEFIGCNLLHLLSSMYFATGQILKAEQTCHETIELASRIGFALRHIHAVNKLALVYQTAGRLARSEQVLEEARTLLHEQGHSNHFAAVQLHFRKIDLLYEWNRLDEVQRLVDRILKQKQTVELPYLLADLWNVRALVLLARHNYTEAQNALDQARALARKTYIWEGLTWRTEWLQTRLWLQRGNVALAAAWASDQAEISSDVLAYPSEVQMVACARIRLAQGARRDVISLLDRLSDAADAGGRRGSLIEIRALKALAHQGEGDVGQAAAEIERALTLAAPERYVRVFLDAGRPMQALLTQWLGHAGAGPLRDYALHLLLCFDAEPQSTVGPQASVSPTGGLLEPLSQREMEVLNLLALGMTNREIALQLIVAPGTVKAHTANIYRKLDVANRTHAVSRARQLGILS